MNIILLDFETTGLETKSCRPIEVGAMRVDEKFNEPEEGVSTLICAPGYPEITEEVERVTKINQQMLNENSVTPEVALKQVGNLVNDDTAFVIAYNTSFDEAVFREEVNRIGIRKDPKISWLLSIPWLCALNDIEKNYEFKSKRLMHVALEYGVPVDPNILHRAIADVELMRKMLKASGTTVQDMHAFQQEPWVYVTIKVEAPWKDNGISTTFAKSKGYNWERAKGDNTERVFSKQWVKRIKQRSFDNELTLPYKVERVMI